ncbi:MAG: dihydroorotate dehydrogenase electron transfer subunit [Deltaproteobacteria bacterium]|nr:dihydroorotate dehydrogenase electron transfer subunit [Deltaproteobacteria bacterium]MBW2015779.1 dihydroorotate dehydrogenase electron transfer subunit [Deltaproteobacteria bacterium]MBW2128663.1 dihydroorotate dehydrogenase electron transfer subunit [Deltaproteobacteria bacterium]MBW2302642.1 dihydroorotate dehydrogenase electron transfer subunit [Deltaproteobacteria bacterium]
MIFEKSAETAYNRPLNRDTWLLGLKAAEIARAAKPGQFIMIRVREEVSPLLRRPFSICGLSGDVIQVLYRVVGEGTRLMTGLVPGERVSLLGPLGNGFEGPRGGEKPVLVGGGVGVAPLFFLLHVLKGEEVSFLAGFPSAEDILTPDLVGIFDVGFHPATEDGSEGYAGFVTDLLERRLEETGRSGKKVKVFACGPRPMLRKVAMLSLERGIPCEVSLEARMACGLGACQGCAVPAAEGLGRFYFHVCRDGPVFPAAAIDWRDS